MSGPTIAIDAGNTRVKFALLAPQDDRQSLPECIEHSAIDSDGAISWDDIRRWAGRADDREPVAMVSGSNPQAVDRLLTEWPVDLPVLRPLDRSRDLDLEIRVDEPARVGIDRLLNAVAVNAVRETDRPAIVIDSGTATTVDLVGTDGAFEGGAILPGIELASRALHQYTSCLPHVEVPQSDDPSPNAIGRNTRDAILTGLLWGHVGAVRLLALKMTDAVVASDTTPALYLTGGASPMLSAYLPDARLLPHLALQGLAMCATARY